MLIEETAEGRESQQFQAVFKFRLFAGLLSFNWCHNNDVISTLKLTETRKSASCWMLKNWFWCHIEKWLWEKLKLLILNQMWSIQIFQSHYSVNLRLSQNLSGLSKILEMTIFSTKILHVYCMCNVIIPERFRICYLASESCDFHVISTIKIFIATVCATCIFIE